MSDTPNNTDITKKPASQSKPRGCLQITGFVTCLLLGLLIIASVVGIFIVRARATTVGFDVANVATIALVLLVLLCAVSLVLIVIFLAPISLFRRLMAMAVVVVGVCALILLLRFTIQLEGFSGRLVPIVNWRWDGKPGPLLEAPQAAAGAGAIDLVTTTPDDFPQFLGPNRDVRVPHVQLARDWDTHPPELLWRRPIGAGWSGFSAVNGYAVTLEQRGPDEVITCYSVADGEVMWANSYTARHETVMGGLGPRSTPSIDEGLVYALGATGFLRCVDGSNGELVWSDNLLDRCGVTEKEDLEAIAWGRSASPLVVDDLLIVPLGGPEGGPYQSLAAFDKKTGELCWLGGDQQAGYASPALATLCDNEQILIVNESSVSGHRLNDGATIWSYPWTGQSDAEANCSQAVVLAGNRVLLTNRRSAELLQIAPVQEDTLEAQSVWFGRGKLKTKFTNVVARDGYIYGLSDGLLECIELETGTRRWKNRRGDYGHGQILGVDDVLLVQAETGEVVMVDFNPDELVELGRLAALSDLTWNTPCLYGSLLLVRNATEAAAYRLKLREQKAE